MSSKLCSGASPVPEEHPFSGIPLSARCCEAADVSVGVVLPDGPRTVFVRSVRAFRPAALQGRLPGRIEPSGLSRRCEASALSLSNLVFFRHGGVKALRKTLFEAPGTLSGKHIFPAP